MEIKKILVKLPAGIKNNLMYFPFFTLLSEEYPKAEIDILQDEDDPLSFKFLPFKTRVFQRPPEKRNLIQTHHYVVNQNEIFNIDLFIDLENSFNSAFIGFNFRAPIRVGIEIGWNKHLLTKRIVDDLTIKEEKKPIWILEKYLEKSFVDFRLYSDQIESKKIETNVVPLFKQPEQSKFILIMLDNFSNVTAQIELWKNFFDSFSGQKFVIWSRFDKEIIYDIFSKIDLNRNQLFAHSTDFSKEMLYLLSKVQGVVTNNAWGEALCTYLGADCVSLFDELEVQNNYHFFRYKPQRILFKRDLQTPFVMQGEERELATMNEVVDYLYFRFKL